MTTIPIPSDLEVALSARAEAEGIPVEELVRRVLYEATGGTGFASPDIEEAWINESQRRIDDTDTSGKPGIPSAEVFAHVEAELRRRKHRAAS